MLTVCLGTSVGGYFGNIKFRLIIDAFEPWNNFSNSQVSWEWLYDRHGQKEENPHESLWTHLIGVV